MLYGMIEVPFVCNFALRKIDFRGRWSVTPKNRGRSKKIQGQIGLKSGGGSLAVCTYLQRGSAPHPHPPGGGGRIHAISNACLIPEIAFHIIKLIVN